MFLPLSYLYVYTYVFSVLYTFLFDHSKLLTVCAHVILNKRILTYLFTYLLTYN